MENEKQLLISELENNNRQMEGKTNRNEAKLDSAINECVLSNK